MYPWIFKGSSKSYEMYCVISKAADFQMREMQYIAESVGPTSLVLMDELGRSSSCDEGIALCFALCEHLALTKVEISVMFFPCLPFSIKKIMKNVSFYFQNINVLPYDRSNIV